MSNATPVAQCTPAALSAAIAATTNGRISLPSGCSMTLTAPVAVNKDLTIEGNGATISGGDTTRLFEVGRDPALSRGWRFAIQNATLTRGRDSGSGGAAVRGAQFGTLTFLNVLFTNNVSTGIGGEDGGGAIFKDEGGRLTIFNSAFVGNRATNGGAVKSLLSNVQIVNSTFETNTALGGNNGGGAVFIDGLEISPSRPSINQGGYWPNGYVNDTYNKARVCGVLFRSNTVGRLHDVNNTGKQGGGLFTHVYGAGGADNLTAVGATVVEIERSIFEDNTAAGDGGGLRSGGNGRGQASVSHSLFFNNRGGHGGGVRLSATNGAFFNTTLISNCAGRDGTTAEACTGSDNGGSSLGGGIAAFDNRYTVARLTVARNRAGGFAGGLQQSTVAADVGSLVDTIVADNLVGNTFGVTRTCGSRFTNGANSWQWALLPNDANDRGCGAAQTADPGVSATPTTCSTVVGSAVHGRTQALRVWLAALGGPVPRSGDVPNAGAVCPASLP